RNEKSWNEILDKAQALSTKTGILVQLRQERRQTQPACHLQEFVVDAPTGKPPPLTSSDDIRKHCYYPNCTKFDGSLTEKSSSRDKLYQIHTGLQHSIIRATQPNCLPLENVTLPQKLKQAGYSTHMVGKWHLGFYKRDCLPTQRGFDTFFGSLLGSGDYYSHYKCEGPGMCGYDLYEGEEAAWEQDRGLYSTVMFTQKAINILANHDPRRQPLFLYLAYQAVHSPLQVPARYLERYKGIPNMHRRKYAAMVSCLDESIHNLTLALKRYGYYDNTVIVYSSDNGGQPLAGGSNWPLRGSKATYWEGGIRAVGFVHSPLLVNKGTKCRSLVHITDWFPTLVTLGEGTLDEDLYLDGYDVWEAISEGHPSPRHDILHNIDPIYTKAKNGSWKAGYGLWNTAIRAALRVGHWKLLTGVPGYSDWVPPQTFSNQRLTNRWHNERVRWDRGKSIWLFNITADPYERVDLSQRYPHLVKKMLLRLAQYNRTAVPYATRPKTCALILSTMGVCGAPGTKRRGRNQRKMRDTITCSPTTLEKGGGKINQITES
ncbi:Arylsulfatase J, partial [Dissostichus eleginoides]